ncbi:unnamed protein product [Arabis nemorensis]|uniref:Uncharacterized protein n=1 Tax=Arabis nemorensis TaxID=586526 RepID=A0A565AZS3_9BRAS|nr:unnamed protein product [Arabis nemorensis]
MEWMRMSVRCVFSTSSLPPPKWIEPLNRNLQPSPWELLKASSFSSFETRESVLRDVYKSTQRQRMEVLLWFHPPDLSRVLLI